MLYFLAKKNLKFLAIKKALDYGQLLLALNVDLGSASTGTVDGGFTRVITEPSLTGLKGILFKVSCRFVSAFSSFRRESDPVLLLPSSEPA